MLRPNTPVRTHKKRYVRYRTYKKYLRKDFNDRCGYCDGLISWMGGYRAFHIDHFVPWKRFNVSHSHLNLKLDYNNLVFSCPYCNTHKAAKWPTGDPYVHNDNINGFIDPCDATYNSSFSRNSEGEIVPLNCVAKYMHKELCLGLERHSLNWKIESLIKLKYELKEEIESGNYSPKTLMCLRQQYNLVNEAIVEVIEVFRELELN
ncbi:MAG: HNH endonuclease [Aureispira sp.]